jgi:hypothetical protein
MKQLPVTPPEFTRDGWFEFPIRRHLYGQSNVLTG